jgi:serine/threonine protein kinase/tetratricopeptide (TPR) repeat protein
MNERTIFLAALDIADPTRRAEYLDSACGPDAGLRQRIETLLQAHDKVGSFLERPLLDTEVEALMDADKPVDPPAPAPVLGTFIGPYKLLQKLGEGGMGTVYLAEQEVPVQRRVALKIIKAGMDSAQVIARFEQERQALAMMDHPNIAKVLDAGTTVHGRPYFVMELVKGIAITKYCDQEHLPPQERLELFVPVCEAVQHAHQKGIIHRDLKPSNVLIALYDGKPIPKVIDFGMAKATAQKLTEKTMFTEVGTIVGTLEYMAPEQAELNNLDVDTRVDIYSLGVILYELLTGSPPFTSQQLRETAFSEMLRLIREVEPPNPSRRLSSSDELPAIAARRKLEPARLTRLVHGDLDWIVMKALAKDRRRRYATPAGLAEDVERYLRREAIVARPPSAAYRLRKFVQRNQGVMLAAVTVTAALLVGTALAAWQAVRATRAKDAALAAAAAEQDAKEKAQNKEAEIRAVLDFVQNQVFAAARPKGLDGGLGREVTLRRALEAALPAVDRSFADRPLIEAPLRMTLGVSFHYLGNDRIAADQFDRARFLYTSQLGPDHPGTLQSMANLANSYEALGRYADALQLREETTNQMRARLGADHPDTIDSMHNLAISYDAVGRRGDALRLREETLALRKAKLGLDHPDTLGTMNSLAISYAAVGRHTDALELYQETLKLIKAKRGPDHPETLQSMNNLAVCYSTFGRHDEALKLYEAALAQRKTTLGPDHPDTLLTMNNLANCFAALGRHAEALKLREETLALQKAKLGSDHPDTLRSMYNLARSYAALGRHAEALQLGKEALALREAKLGPDHPDTLQSLSQHAYSLVQLQRGAEAVPVIDEYLRRAAAKIIDARQIRFVANLRLRHFEQAHDAGGCRATAEIWEKLQRTDAESLYKAACYRAVTAAVIRATDRSPGAAKGVGAEADRAMAWLGKAVAAGYKDVAQLKDDKDLIAVRGRADFQELLAKLEADK